MEIKKYQNNDLTVTWEPSKCIHSGLCFRGLPRVFNPKRKPWIELAHSDIETIIEQVNKCPSGAISYTKNSTASSAMPNMNTAETSIKIKVTAAGPLLIEGNFTLENKGELSDMKAKVTALCRCGQSANKPFCDGSHRKVAFDSE